MTAHIEGARLRAAIECTETAQHAALDAVGKARAVSRSHLVIVARRAVRFRSGESIKMYAEEDVRRVLIRDVAASLQFLHIRRLRLLRRNLRVLRARQNDLCTLGFQERLESFRDAERDAFFRHARRPDGARVAAAVPGIEDNALAVNARRCAALASRTRRHGGRPCGRRIIRSFRRLHFSRRISPALEVDVRTARRSSSCGGRAAARTARKIAKVHDHAVRHRAAFQRKHVVIAAALVHLCLHDDAYRSRIELPEAHLRRELALDLLALCNRRREACA